jgi:hypothetical protein
MMITVIESSAASNKEKTKPSRYLPARLAANIQKYWEMHMRRIRIRITMTQFQMQAIKSTLN